MSFTAQDVMALRNKTGLGMMDCKKALAENGGDPAKAEEWLRAQRKGKMDARTERATGEGRIAISVAGDRAAMVEIRTETDFTANTDAFVQMADAVAQMALTLPEGAFDSATPEMTRRIDDVRLTTGENVNLARGIVMTGGGFGHYLHFNGKRAAIVQVDGAAPADLLKGICQHIVFHDPRGIDEKDIDAADLARIRSEGMEEARASGKPAQIAEKIAEGKVRKFLEESTLLNQKYVLDESKAVREVLPKGVTIRRFVRYTLGA